MFLSSTGNSEGQPVEPSTDPISSSLERQVQKRGLRKHLYGHALQHFLRAARQRAQASLQSTSCCLSTLCTDERLALIRPGLHVSLSGVCIPRPVALRS